MKRFNETINLWNGSLPNINRFFISASLMILIYGEEGLCCVVYYRCLCACRRILCELGSFIRSRSMHVFSKAWSYSQLRAGKVMRFLFWERWNSVVVKCCFLKRQHTWTNIEIMCARFEYFGSLLLFTTSCICFILELELHDVCEH